LHQQNYNISNSDFASVSDKIFAAIRSIVDGQETSEINQILLDYKS